MKQTQLWIGDTWIPGASTVTLHSPYNGNPIAEIGYASVEQAEQAIEVAAAAFKSFYKVPAYTRAEILRKVASAMEKRHEELSRLIAEESAKPIQAARGEIDRTIQTYLFAAEAARDNRGETIPMDAAPHGENHIAYTQRKPLGVVTAITPFNFPMNLVAHKVGPAIAAGNTIVLKPAEQTPLSSLILAELFQQAGLPAGVLNIIPGSGAELGEILTTHPKVAFITFTGSPRVGKLIRAQAGLRRVTLELGSNSPLLIDEGFSPDELEKIADETTNGSFNYDGQVCISIQRVYVHKNIYDGFVKRMVQRAEKLKIGDPLAEDTNISALINTTAADRLKKWVEHAVSKGAVVQTGGTFEGNVMAPTILTNVSPDAELNTEEAFGPIITITPFETWSEAIDMANRSKFGLNSGAFTKDIERAFQAAEKLESGGVLINQIPTFRVDQMPYGGVKESGSGREGIRYAMEEMMDIKLVVLRMNVYQP
ncbi:aldehyde dehydrogenase family protein [Aneurinibacillus uraniidurans]|uniref:aldehyde dehydrogenase family protein n=1 Tax=Aneurinibacillus uraniidurans TaxID=2966586 RepID=UPI00234BB0F3|nr:aldehyde dehydrogenase family protein [Aneurinibacillus sp. B1]WCN38646.1 aldehyde dehydrogenase family protein [Aneurinibacillus sp. B1]